MTKNNGNHMTPEQVAIYFLSYVGTKLQLCGVPSVRRRVVIR
jgi:hypothetical protein